MKDRDDWLAPGKAVLIRTVTHYYIGTVEEIDGLGVWLADDCSEVATTGPLTCMKDGPGKGWRSERVWQPILIPHGVIVSLQRWAHDVPAESIGS